ncbi:MAG: choice-of-anchor D domain-containing protein, partial [Candidatus Cloacimonadaceae bacterium]
VFSGGSTSNLRPNLKLAYQAAPDGPLVDAIPVSLAFGDVAVGSNAVKTFTIRNFGNQTLTGTITTPAGYTVAEAGRSTRILESTGGSRYSMGFTVAAGASKTYNLNFAPTAATAYNGNVVISGNAVNEASVNIAVSGTGYILPTISIDGNALSANLQVGASGTDSFTITNNGSRPLTFDICMAQQSSRTIDKPQAASKQDKSIAGSTFTLDATHYLPGTTVDWTFTVTNGSTDSEWITDVIITFPTGVTVNSVTNFVGGSGGDLTPDLSSGEGVTVTWHGETYNGYGMIKGGESASATLNVSIASSFSGYLTLPWTINGDIYGSDPHTLSGTVALAEDFLPIDWLSVHPVSGSIAGGESVTISANFSAVGMAVGNYAAQITVYSNDTANPSPNVNATMEVWDSVPTPVISGITKIDGGFRITWSAVEHADCYEVWRATEPYGTYERIGANISALQYDDLSNLPLGFYYVKAIRN